MAIRRVSGAWPVKPGVLFPADLGRLQVKNASNVEVAIAIQASRALFPDGSCRSVTVQFDADLTVDTPVQWSVVVGGPRRTTTDLTFVEPVYDSGSASVPSMANQTTLVPADSQYWCDTFAALVPLMPEADEAADTAKTFFRTDAGTASTFGEWASDIASNSGRGVSTYEHMHGYYCAAIRADSQAKRLAYFARFWKTAINRFGGEDYARVGTLAAAWPKVWEPDSTLPVASNSSSGALTNEPNTGDAIGVAVAYIGTGWKQPWRNLSHWGSWLWSGTNETNAKNAYVTADRLIRFNTSWYMSYRFAAYVVGATMQVPGGYGAGRDNDVASWTNDLDWSLDALADHIYTTANSAAYLDGIVGQRPTATDGGTLAAGKFPTFQLAVVAKVLIFYYQNIDDDVRIPTWLQTMADFVIGQAIDNTTYYQMPYLHNETPSGASDKEPYYLPFFTQLFGFVYAQTANATYQTWALRCANARELTNPSPFIQTIKALGEYFGGNCQSAKFYIDGGAVRPVAGAHPTSIQTRPTYGS